MRAFSTALSSSVPLAFYSAKTGRNSLESTACSSIYYPDAAEACDTDIKATQEVEVPLSLVFIFMASSVQAISENNNNYQQRKNNHRGV